MEKINYSKYYLIKAVLASNLEEGVKENLVNSLINCCQSQPVIWYEKPINGLFYKGDGGNGI